MTIETAGCALRGLIHAKNGMPCQDKIYSFTLGNVTAVALSDGAGSSRLSHYGASRAAGVICQRLCADFGKFMNASDVYALRNNILEYLRHKISLLSLELGCDIDDLHSTLLSVASEGERYILVHIGDGAAGAFTKNEVFTVSEPHNGEFANLVDCIFSPETFRSMNVMRGRLDDSGKKISGFVLMSDGTQPGYYDARRKRFVRWLLTVKRKCFELEESMREKFLCSELREAAENSRTMDDCSIIFMNMK